MAGKLHNEIVLTKEYLSAAIREGVSTASIAKETGINRRTVSNYISRFMVASVLSPDEIRLKKMQAEAQALEDRLQRLVLEIDLLRVRIEKKGMLDMTKITALAEKLRRRRG